MTTATKMSQAQVLASLIRAVIETVYECSEGSTDWPCPCGPMYAAFMNVMTADQFNQLCAAACKTGLVRRSNHALYAVHAKLDWGHMP